MGTAGGTDMSCVPPYSQSKPLGPESDPMRSGIVVLGRIVGAANPEFAFPGTAPPSCCLQIKNT